MHFEKFTVMRRAPTFPEKPTQSKPRRTISEVIRILENVQCDPSQINYVPKLHKGLCIEKTVEKVVSNPIPLHCAMPNVPTKNVVLPPADVSTASANGGRAFCVVWGKVNTRKHKTWEGDGRLELSVSCWKLVSDSGICLGSMRPMSDITIEPGIRIRMGNKDVEVVEEIESVPTVVHSTSDTEPPKKKLKLALTHSQAAYKKGLGGKPLVFPQPPDTHQFTHNPRKLTVRDVVLDSLMSRTLRTHQRDGVVFLYECVMGFKNPQYYGAILADEMGLGKTLQTIALIWTLLKQGPYGTAICKEVLVITPSSLCANWGKEFIKWLGRERIQTYVVDKSHKASDFVNYPHIPIMIISYEQFVRSFSCVEKNQFDLIVCDEAHRLKNSSVKAAQLLGQLACKRRIFLTGTPIQNHLQEYFTLIDLVNPGILGSSAEFRFNYENPIIVAQQPYCEERAKHMAQEKSMDLNRIISKFILRRTQEIMENYLPCKVELIVCCGLSQVQKQLYETVIDTWFSSDVKNPFQVIATLRKICNHPCLVGNLCDGRLLVQNSAKLSVIETIMKNNVIKKKESVILISYSTKFLDILQKLCSIWKIECLRLDGSTPVTQRKPLVDAFNAHAARVFLMSARAGGVGLNLTGASRLVLTDGDWNPSNDLQALARIWRDGQKKNVTIYRLMCAGTIEEKIFQRQLSKLALGDSVEDPKNLSSALKFSEEELKDLFTPNLTSASITHEKIQCRCLTDMIDETEGAIANNIEDGEVRVNQLQDWKHHGKPFTDEFLQEIGLAGSDVPTFIFEKITNETNMMKFDMQK